MEICFPRSLLFSALFPDPVPCLSFNRLKPIISDQNRNTWVKRFGVWSLLLQLIQSGAAWA
ncbi:MAG: hypothetical protein KGM95_09915, partial [Betaproteobacteria bacterium]|nr:hypothetical protein [Betaproteobacteria bacterium]